MATGMVTATPTGMGTATERGMATADLAPSQFAGDGSQGDLADRGHLHCSGPQGIATADLDVRPPPDAHAAGDLPAHHPFAQSLGEGHRDDLRLLEGPSRNAALSSLPRPR